MKLTLELRNSIIYKVIKKRFVKEHEKLDELESKLAQDVYNSIEQINRISDLPSSWFSISKEFIAYFNGQYCNLELPEERLFPLFVRNGNLCFDVEHSLTKQFNELSSYKHNLELSKTELKSELKRVLFSVTTDKQLVKIWPEATEYFNIENYTNLPAVLNVDKLRSLLSV